MKILQLLKIWKIARRTEKTIVREVYMNDEKKWYHSRTVWFNLLLGSVKIATELQGSGMFSDSRADTIFALIVGIGNVILRLDTSKPIKK